MHECYSEDFSNWQYVFTFGHVNYSTSSLTNIDKRAKSEKEINARYLYC